MTFSFAPEESKIYRFFHHFLVSRWEEEKPFFDSFSVASGKGKKTGDAGLAGNLAMILQVFFFDAAKKKNSRLSRKFGKSSENLAKNFETFHSPNLLNLFFVKLFNFLLH